jgi:aminopeptidase N
MNNQLSGSQTPVAGGNGVGDSRYPQLGNSGYDVQQYNLDLNVVDVASSNLDATTTIEAKATQSLSSFNLNFAGFEIESIVVNGQTAEFSRDGDELTVTPTEALHQGDDFTVEVKYKGSPEPTQSLSFSSEESSTFPVGWVTHNGGSYVVGEPNGAETFYPVNNHPLDKATYNFRVTTPKPYEVAANGVLEETIDNGDTNTYVFEANDPMASYLSTVNIYKGFNTETQTSPDGVPIRNYFAEGIPEEKLEPFKRQPEMIDYFSEIFGSYPFEVYGSAVVNTPINVDALETQTLSVFGLEALDNPKLEETVAHELAHQWFGNSLSLSDWGDIWLNESFATYAQGLWVEESQGGSEALNGWVKEQFANVALDFDNLVAPGNPPGDDLFNFNSIYTWGSVGLHALRQEIGDEAFFDSLKTYTESFQGGNVTPEDFISITEEASNQELDAFFDRWFYTETLTSIPELGLFAGTAEGDTLNGTNANDSEVLSGLDGNDTLIGNGGVNVLVGNSGDDLLEGGGTQNNYYAGTGNDTIYAKGETNLIYSGDDGNDNDTIWLNGGTNQVILTAGSGQDVINNFQVGSTTLFVDNIEQLSFVGSADGTRIMQGDDLLAVATSQSADVFSSNIDTIFQSATA